MVYHYKFYQLISNDTQCKTQWDKTLKISAEGPHKLQQVGLLSIINNETKNLIDKKSIPVFKLTWKLKKETWQEKSVLAYLFYS